MLELRRRISGWRLSRARAVAPVIAGLLGAIAVVALLTPGGSAGRRLAAPLPATRPPRTACPPRPGPAPVGSLALSLPTGHSAISGVLGASLRTARHQVHAPAVTAAVVVCGRVLWAGATGVLDLRSRRPASNQSLFILNSATKTVVATMVMLEIQNGHLSLGTRLSRFYPWLPNARHITIRMLLNMTSGLPDYLSNPRIQWMIHHRPRHHWTIDQVLTGLGTGLGRPRFAPGREYQYSDTNYIVLGGILEHITRASIEYDFQQLIAQPLGITSATFVPTPAAEALAAHPYVRNANGSLTSEWIPGYGVSSAVWGPVFTDGGLAVSSLDLAWFSNGLLGGRLVHPAGVRQMIRIGRGDYGFGIRSRSFEHHVWLGHRGYFGGFEMEGWTDPSRQLTIAVATNLQTVGGEPTSTRVWSVIAGAYDRHTAGTARLSAG
jgi:D-alanyl-D-alanine carboxypeptidase